MFDTCSTDYLVDLAQAAKPASRFAALTRRELTRRGVYPWDCPPSPHPPDPPSDAEVARVSAITDADFGTATPPCYVTGTIDATLPVHWCGDHNPGGTVPPGRPLPTVATHWRQDYMARGQWVQVNNGGRPAKPTKPRRRKARGSVSVVRDLFSNP